MPGWTNEDGEPIMDGAAWRFEQQLDMDAQADYYADHFYDNDGEAPCEQFGPGACEGDDLNKRDGRGVCPWCDTDWGVWDELFV